METVIAFSFLSAALYILFSVIAREPERKQDEYITLQEEHLQLQKKYQKVLKDTSYLITKYERLLKEWNALAKRINKLGGEDFLKKGGGQLSPQEIRTLITLCHPDKHGGSKAASDMTAKLLEMRK